VLGYQTRLTGAVLAVWYIATAFAAHADFMHGFLCQSFPPNFDAASPDRVRHAPKHELLVRRQRTPAALLVGTHDGLGLDVVNRLCSHRPSIHC